MTIPKKELPPIQEKICFIITAIGTQGSPEREHADKVLRYLIEPVCQKLNYKALRVDTESVNGNINERIINHLKNDELVIADLTGHNPNAFYELGYRQALGLPLIPIIDDRDSLPFDVMAENTVFYNTDVSKIDDCKNHLEAMMLNFQNYIMPNKRPKIVSEFDVINEKLDKIIKQTDPINRSLQDNKSSSLEFNVAAFNEERFKAKLGKKLLNTSSLTERSKIQLHNPKDTE